MQTFDQSLYQLYKAGSINLDEALRNADSRNNLRLKLKLEAAGKLNPDKDMKLDDDSRYD